MIEWPQIQKETKKTIKPKCEPKRAEINYLEVIKTKRNREGKRQKKILIRM